MPGMRETAAKTAAEGVNTMTECEFCGRTLPVDGDPDDTLCDDCARAEITNDPTLARDYAAAEAAVDSEWRRRTNATQRGERWRIRHYPQPGQ